MEKEEKPRPEESTTVGGSKITKESEMGSGELSHEEIIDELLKQEMDLSKRIEELKGTTVVKERLQESKLKGQLEGVKMQLEEEYSTLFLIKPPEVDIEQLKTFLASLKNFKRRTEDRLKELREEKTTQKVLDEEAYKIELKNQINQKIKEIEEFIETTKIDTGKEEQLEFEKPLEEIKPLTDRISEVIKEEKQKLTIENIANDYPVLKEVLGDQNVYKYAGASLGVNLLAQAPELKMLQGNGLFVRNIVNLIASGIDLPELKYLTGHKSFDRYLFKMACLLFVDGFLIGSHVSALTDLIILTSIQVGV